MLIRMNRKKSKYPTERKPHHTPLMTMMIIMVMIMMIMMVMTMMMICYL